MLILKFENSGSLKSHIVIASRNEITAWQSSNYEKRQCKNVFRLPDFRLPEWIDFYCHTDSIFLTENL
ncbi:MAG: hypothetical protein IKH45_08625 [Neisseriaceae bacterium]|nr:hypothetical protein [Neisseriaceae bacterium]